MASHFNTLNDYPEPPLDLRQNFRINDRTKKYFIAPFPETDDKPLPSVQSSTKSETVKGGTVTWAYNLTDTGERREMFGLTARHLIVKQTMESTKDSCGGESKMTIEEDGWFIYLIPETARCEIDLPRRAILTATADLTQRFSVLQALLGLANARLPER
jgi:hypothetical protein